MYAFKVLSSHDLVHSIASFQRGVCVDDAPITQLTHTAPDLRGIPAVADFFKTIFHDTFEQWLARLGVPGLTRLIATTSTVPRHVIFAYAAWVGNLSLLRFLLAQLSTSTIASLQSSALLLDLAATQGHMQVVTFLHARPGQRASTAAMNGAAANGHLDMVQFLHTHRVEGCTTEAMDGACERGHLDVIEWLSRVREARCTVRALEAAATRGHLHVVQFLVDEFGILCSASAVLAAARAGHNSVVRFLSQRLLDKETARQIIRGQARLAGNARHLSQVLSAM
ncbi:hypothetical protein H310_02681 [Aphanomyces invadans]|uniref:Uncharacterized protein n=1 Tax=Aphanomyces invadans TaxID=157072 RepID=A0A024UJ36_9STRA|nr:hypothetical protein H310_02681 [Aphanomyces invadans]ETW06421.1 hypothetical protein H310_02681 [Aphanomyces invadans]RHY17280.1 hypothetical protein DYB32_010545 [Aphanomyces invadans]|eukprot:XP_008864496.1 hypothetical protein H310_02681 [Aphanomyces invadans]